jgi:hypothetical protein
LNSPFYDNLELRQWSEERLFSRFSIGGVPQMTDNQLFDPHEWALREGEPEHQGRLTSAMLIFSLGFCALVFWAGWKEVSAYERCGLHGALTVGRSCPAAAAAATTSKEAAAH